MWRDGKQTAECGGIGLRRVPTSLDPAVQVLNLSENPLHSLPAHAFASVGLVNLQKIYLRGCRLTAIDPSALTGLTNLVVLDLSDNQLTMVPGSALRATAALRELWLDRNAIQILTDTDLLGSSALVKLSLADCQLREVAAAAFDSLKILESLTLSGNRLREMPQRAVVALRRLHNVELHANPWHCDCRLRPLFEWLALKNVPYPVVPTCHGPPSVAGTPFDRMSLAQFACRPQLLPMARRVLAARGENATLSCRIAAVPRADIVWYRNGRRLPNGSRLDRARGPVLTYEEGDTERVSHLVIPDVHNEDALHDFLCVGTNPAGDVETNFTLSVGRRLALLMPLDSGQIAGIIVGLILLLVVVIALVLIGMSHCRRKRSTRNLKLNGTKTVVHSNGGHHNVVAVEAAAEEDMVNPVQKPPRLSDFGLAPHSHPAGVAVADGGVGFSPSQAVYGTMQNSTADPQSSVYVRGPDLIKELETGPASTYGMVPYYSPSYLTGSNGHVVGGGVLNPMADDSYELSQLHSEVDSDRNRLDPSIYGYPADYGLPIPEVVSREYSGDMVPPVASNYGTLPYSSSAPDYMTTHPPPPEPAPDSAYHRLHQPQQSLYNEENARMNGPRPHLSSTSSTVTLDSRLATSNGEENVLTHPSQGHRHARQVGVPVLPPHPSQQSVSSMGTTAADTATDV